MKTVVYTSNTGSTERYANMLAERLGCEAVSLSKLKERPEGEIIYLGWVMAGAIQGLVEAREKFGELKAVVAVGMLPSEKAKGEVIEKNGVTELFYYLPGVLDIGKLKGMHKMIMGMMLKMMKSQVKDSDDPNAKKALELFEEGFDGVKEENLDELVEELTK